MRLWSSTTRYQPIRDRVWSTQHKAWRVVGLWLLSLALAPAIAFSQNGPRLLTFAHVVSGGGWETTITLANIPTTTSPANLLQGNIAFYGDDGSPLVLNVILPQTGETIQSSSVPIEVSIMGSFIIQTKSIGASVVSGWARVVTHDPNVLQNPQTLNGQAIFTFAPAAGIVQEGTVPLANQMSGPITVPFDNTNGFRTAIALTNEDNAAAAFTLVGIDDIGTSIPILTGAIVTVRARGHTALYLDSFPQLQNRRGVVVISTGNYPGNIAGMALRFNPTGAFTSIPVIRWLQ